MAAGSTMVRGACVTAACRPWVLALAMLGCTQLDVRRCGVAAQGLSMLMLRGGVAARTVTIRNDVARRDVAGGARLLLDHWQSIAYKALIKH